MHVHLLTDKEKAEPIEGSAWSISPALAATPFVTPIFPTRSGKMLFRCAAVPEAWWNRGAGVSCEADHEWVDAAGAGAAGKGAGADAGGAETGVTGSHGAGEYSFA